jgi:hypothetical protein
MKSTLLFLAAFSVTSLSAQVTIGNNDMVDPNDSIRVSYALASPIDHTLADTNYLWDFSALDPLAQEMIRYETPSAIPFNFLASVSLANSSPDSLPFIGAVPSNFTDHWKTGTSGFRQVGFSFEYAPLGNFDVPVIFNNADYIYRFPLNYGNVDTSDADYDFSIPNLAYIGQTIHRVTVVDGWGTLITPFGTFNTLRVRSVIDRIDTIGLDSVNGFTSVRPTEVEYKWLAPGMKIPVLEIDAQVLFSNEVVTNIQYQDSLRDSLFQVSVPEPIQAVSAAMVYPNPASGSCSVSFLMQSPAPVELELTDLSGRVVRSYGKQEASAGYNARTIDLDGVSAGMYLVRIISGTSVITRPVVAAN